MRFDQLSLAQPILNTIARQGYETATPIQAQAIPHGLEGRDVLGCAQTGTGKTAAFALPILHRLDQARRDRQSRATLRALVLCPTRELATQIADAMHTYSKGLNIRNAVVFGGVSQYNQVRRIRQGVDILIATPGRLLDLMNQGHINLRMIDMFVLDEADRMLDMGFMPDIQRIVRTLPEQRQTLLFSATMPRPIRTLADELLDNPAVITITPDSPAVESIDQSVYFVPRKDKPELLADLVRDLPMHRAIVFTRTKHGADKVVRQLRNSGIASTAIHGNKTQNQRQRSLASFRDDKVNVLVATDIASRGIDVDGVTHVVNYDLTHEPETYVHRIGRTARAGAEGAAISFCDQDELGHLRAIERMLRDSISVSDTHPLDPNWSAPAGDTQRPRRRPRTRPAGARPGGGGGRPRNSARPRKPGNKPNGRPAAASRRRTR